MKENVFEVLMYLFENYMYNEDAPQRDREALESELSEAGFTRPEIRKAFDWLDGLANAGTRSPVRPSAAGSIRVFGDAECGKLDLECRGFLLFLEQCEILAPASREVVIDRVMALEEDEVDLDTLKWIVLMVLFNRPGEEEAYSWMENLLFDNPVHLVH